MFLYRMAPLDSYYRNQPPQPMKVQIILLVLIFAALAAYWQLREVPPRIVVASSPELVMPVTLDDGTGPLYFKTPEAIVEEAAALIDKKDWRKLARYYDLSGSRVTRSTLDSGVFFMLRPSSQPPPLGALGERDPFIPGFKFLNTEPTKEADVTQVNLEMEIDQGGGPKQKVRSHFLTKKAKEGWQLLPSPAS